MLLRILIISSVPVAYFQISLSEKLAGESRVRIIPSPDDMNRFLRGAAPACARAAGSCDRHRRGSAGSERGFQRQKMKARGEKQHTDM